MPITKKPFKFQPQIQYPQINSTKSKRSCYAVQPGNKIQSSSESPNLQQNHLNTKPKIMHLIMITINSQTNTRKGRKENAYTDTPHSHTHTDNPERKSQLVRVFETRKNKIKDWDYQKKWMYPIGREYLSSGTLGREQRVILVVFVGLDGVILIGVVMVIVVAAGVILHLRHPHPQND